MSFKMQCPKCKGLDYSIERDNRTFGAVAQAFELVFHCRCGKQMFGEQILKEYEAQKKEWEADTDRVDEPDVPERSSQRAAREQLEQVFEASRQTEAAKAAPEPEPVAEPEAAPAKAAAPKKAKPKKAAKPAAEAAAGTDPCAWPGCENPRRKNSKYCSRACSNKNARHRHKLRAKKGDKADNA
jgi:hypothetical protein